ncbi:hypothetical protein [Streptomyces sp. CFMR 7]|uniref:hypothetical protein n=1 Tax=Streptomyces sp. CFMR 7 TaxID=1649184 RepID=UPI000AB46E66|nr:hypothetical protein [Streptomyces sp. CFMR 7]
MTTRSGPATGVTPADRTDRAGRAGTPSAPARSGHHVAAEPRGRASASASSVTGEIMNTTGGTPLS